MSTDPTNAAEQIAALSLDDPSVNTQGDASATSARAVKESDPLDNASTEDHVPRYRRQSTNGPPEPTVPNLAGDSTCPNADGSLGGAYASACNPVYQRASNQEIKRYKGFEEEMRSVYGLVTDVCQNFSSPFYHVLPQVVIRRMCFQSTGAIYSQLSDSRMWSLATGLAQLSPETRDPGKEVYQGLYERLEKAKTNFRSSIKRAEDHSTVLSNSNHPDCSANSDAEALMEDLRGDFKAYLEVVMDARKVLNAQARKSSPEGPTITINEITEAISGLSQPLRESIQALTQRFGRIADSKSEYKHIPDTDSGRETPA